MAIVCLPLANAVAQKIDFQFQIYQLDEPIADALQTRLIDGGQPAVDAMAKMPDFVQQHRVSLEAEVTIQVQSGQRAKGASSARKLDVDKDIGDKWQVIDGLDMEIDPVVDSSGSLVDVNIIAEYSVRFRGGAKIHRFTSSVVAKTGMPVLLNRWQEGEDILLFIGSATLPGAGEVAANPNKLIYIDAAMYESAANAQAKRAPIGRVTFPCRSGQRAKSEIIAPFSYEANGGGLEKSNLGLTVEVDPRLDPSGSGIDLNASVEYTEKKGGSERLPSGDRVPKVEIRTAKTSVQLPDGKTGTVDVKISSMGDPNPKPDLWEATLGCNLYEVK